MILDQNSIDEFKDYVVQSTNDDIYYQLKDYLANSLDEDQDFADVIDYFINNLTGSLTWTDD